MKKMNYEFCKLDENGALRYAALCDAFGEDAVREYLAELPAEA